MDPFEIKDVLNSMSVVVDTREQDTIRARRRYAVIGLPVIRQKIDYGDYTYTANLPTGMSIDTEHPKCVVERKMDLDELAACLGRDRKRFESEFIRAKSNGAKIYLLVENGGWSKILGKRYRTKMHPNALIGSIFAFIVRYNCNLIFCDELESGRLIKEILYRDLKERLERGDYG